MQYYALQSTGKTKQSATSQRIMESKKFSPYSSDRVDMAHHSNEDMVKKYEEELQELSLRITSTTKLNEDLSQQSLTLQDIIKQKEQAIREIREDLLKLNMKAMEVNKENEELKKKL